MLFQVDLVSPKPKLLIIAEELCKCALGFVRFTELTCAMCRLAPFADVFYLSALKDDGVSELEVELRCNSLSFITS